MISEMVETHGGLLMTWHEQQADGGCRMFRERLDQYARGDLPAEAVIAAPCDAPEITP